MREVIGFYNYTVILTYLGVSFAVVGMCNAMSGNCSWAMLCLMLCGLCDMFDGTVAKTRKRSVQEKQFGIQIDSLADMICFGFLPIVIGVSLGLNEQKYFPVLIFFTLTALIRLAYFNVTEEERQQMTSESRVYYEGLPVTTVALLLPLIYSFRNFITYDFVVIYALALMVIGIAFVTKFRVVKLKMRGMMMLLMVGILEFLWFIKEF